MLYRHVFDKIHTESCAIFPVFVNFAAPQPHEISEALHKRPLNLPTLSGCLQEIQLNVDHYLQILKVLFITLKNITYLLPSVRCLKFTYQASFPAFTGLWWINQSVKSLNWVTGHDKIRST